jgi:hypothetical protein
MIAAPCLLATPRHTSVDATQVRGIGSLPDAQRVNGSWIVTAGIPTGHKIVGHPKSIACCRGRRARPDRSKAATERNCIKKILMVKVRLSLI